MIHRSQHEILCTLLCDSVFLRSAKRRQQPPLEKRQPLLSNGCFVIVFNSFQFSSVPNFFEGYINEKKSWQIDETGKSQYWSLNFIQYVFIFYHTRWCYSYKCIRKNSCYKFSKWTALEKAGVFEWDRNTSKSRFLRKNSSSTIIEASEEDSDKLYQGEA